MTVRIPKLGLQSRSKFVRHEQVLRRRQDVLEEPMREDDREAGEVGQTVARKECDLARVRHELEPEREDILAGRAGAWVRSPYPQLLIDERSVQLRSRLHDASPELRCVRQGVEERGVPLDANELERIARPGHDRRHKEIDDRLRMQEVERRLAQEAGVSPDVGQEQDRSRKTDLCFGRFGLDASQRPPPPGLRGVG